MQVTDPGRIDLYYQALLDRAPDYVGVFFVGVRTTSVFCIATCRARKPKRENVIFYTTAQDASLAGFRPCKVCRPSDYASTVPPDVSRAIALLDAQPGERFSDLSLRKQGLNTVQLRRWFLKQHGMTFQAYQRAQRLNHALRSIKEDNSVLSAGLASGYGSLSGFTYSYKKALGHSPMHSVYTNIIHTHRFASPLGQMIVGATDKGVCLLEFVDGRRVAAEFEDLCKLLHAQITVGENEHTRQAEAELREYFAGQRKEFQVTLDMPGTDFQLSVWGALLAIPFGETVSYQTQAQKIGNLKAIRAVALANGANRISIVIPCHRVIGKDGSLTGYGGGLERKRWLITHEQEISGFRLT